MNGLPLPALPKPSRFLRAEPLLVMATLLVAVVGLSALFAGSLLSSWPVAGAGVLGLALAFTGTMVAATKEQREVGDRRAVLDAFADDLAAHYDVTYVERLHVPDYGLTERASEPVIVSVRANGDGTELALIAVTRDGRVALYGGADSSAEYKPQRALQAA